MNWLSFPREHLTMLSIAQASATRDSVLTHVLSGQSTDPVILTMVGVLSPVIQLGAVPKETLPEVTPT